MDRKVYITNGVLNLSQYIPSVDDVDCYNCWRDEETKNGFNYRITETLDEYKQGEMKSRFIATIVRCSDNVCIGSIFVSPVNMPADLAVMIYKPFRKQGYGTMAFSLGVKYCFESLELNKIFAGCYEGNRASEKMLTACGFIPNPEGNSVEKHYLTGHDLTQYDYVRYKV